MTISVIIFTLNRIEELSKCLTSVFSQSIAPYEIIVVDASDANIDNKLRENFNNKLIYIHTDKRGLTRQRNIGLRKAKGDIVVFLDDDVILANNYLREIKRVFELYPDNIGGVTGKVIELNAEIKGLIRRFFNIFARIFLLYRPGNGKFQASGFPTRYEGPEKIVPVEFLFGCNMAFKRDVISQFGFDENLYRYMYMEDDDIAYRVSRKYQNYYTPFAKVIHTGPKEKRNEFVRASALIKNFFYLHRKNFPKKFKYELAFNWAILGWIIMELIRGFINLDFSRFKGIIIGLIENIKEDILMNKSKIIGSLYLIISVSGATIYTCLLFKYTLLILKITSLVIVLLICILLSWIGWTMVTTPSLPIRKKKE